MSDNNNYPEPIITESPVSKVDVKILVAVVFLVCLALYFVMTFSQNRFNSPFNFSNTPSDEVSRVTINSDGIPKTNLQGTIPTPLASYISSTTPEQITSSYMLRYPEGEQSTVTYEISGTVSENMTAVADWLYQNAWVVMSSSTTQTLGSFYALHGSGNNATLNITIVPSPDTRTAQIVVSHFIKS